jgi:EmrB/QacA subfamily drug resistance transporter
VAWEAHRFRLPRGAFRAMESGAYKESNIGMNANINYLLLTTALLGTFFSGTATRIVSISMPTIANSLATDLLGVSWALLSYQLSNIGLSIVFGRVSDLWGREKVFALGFLVFTIGSLLCGLSQSLLQLILFRFAQGVGAAMLQSSSRALAAESVPETLAGRAQGYMTTAHHTGFIIGPSIGGLMIDYLSWRWSFFFLVPIGICGTLLTLLSLKRGSAALPRRGVSIDYAGAALLFATTSALVVIFDRRAQQIIGANARAALIILFFICLAGLIFHETRTKSPILNLSLFKIRRFSLSVISLLVVASCYALTGFLLPFYLQDVLHLTPTGIGLLFMAPSVITVALAPLSGYLADRLGPRIPASIGVAFMLISLALGGFLRVDSHWMLPALLIIVAAITNGIFNPANSTAMIGMMPAEHRGFASAVNHVTFGFGNVLGVALSSLLMSIAFEHHTGLPGTALTTANRSGFVAALNTTFEAAILLCLIALATSLLGSGRRSAKLERHGH